MLVSVVVLCKYCCIFLVSVVVPCKYCCIFLVSVVILCKYCKLIRFGRYLVGIFCLVVAVGRRYGTDAKLQSQLSEAGIHDRPGNCLIHTSPQ